MARELTSSEAGILHVLLDACGCEHVLRAIAGLARDEAMKNGRDGSLALAAVMRASRCISDKTPNMPDPRALALELEKLSTYTWSVEGPTEEYFELLANDSRATTVSISWEPHRAPAARCVARCRDNWLPGISSDTAQAASQIAMNVLPAALLMSPAVSTEEQSQ